MPGGRGAAPRRTTNDRILGALLVGWVLLGMLWVRCLDLQILRAGPYVRAARAQHQVTQPLPARRGAILDRHGRPLAVSVLVPSVTANPRQMSDKGPVAQRLADMVGGNPADIRRRLEKDKGFVWVARQVDPSLTPQLVAMRRAGVGIEEEPRRLYPQGHLAAHLLGFVNIDHQGLEGLEMAFNGTLRGREGWQATRRDAKGDLLFGPWTTRLDPQAGYDIVLTIDDVVQQAAEEALAWGAKKFKAKGGSVVILDPYTGEVLAIANHPSYDPNEPGKASPDRRRNRAVTDLFEPGSIFKVVTAAALFEEGRVSPEETFDCEQGVWPTVAGHVLHDHHGHGTLSFRDVIRLSSNIGTAKAAQRLTPDELYRYVRAFGFGEQTGVEALGEISGMVPHPTKWWKVSMYNIPIGQGVAVTPMQLAVMTSVIANGGLRVRPTLIKAIRSEDGTVVRTPLRRDPERVISYATATLLQSILTDVVESGTGQLAKVQGLTVAGKTGTAQKIEPSGRYSHSRYVASFVGFGPVPDSHFVIVVSMDEPRPAYFGGSVSAPMFKRIVERLAGYWAAERPEPSLARLPEPKDL